MSKKTQHTKDVVSEKCPRAYHRGPRAPAMDDNRARIVAAARELILGDNALSGFSMENVARQAGVTRVTIYNHLASRRGLLEAVLDEVGTRGRLHEQLHEVFVRHDAQEALRTYVEVFCEFWGDDRALHRRLRGFAQLDAEFAAAMASRYDLHHHAIASLLLRLHTDDNTPAPEILQEQVQTVMALTGFEFYDAMAGGARGPQEVAPLMFHLTLAALGLDAKR